MSLPVNRPEWFWTAKQRLGLAVAVLSLAGLSATEVSANLYICGWREVIRVEACAVYGGSGEQHCSTSMSHEPVYCTEGGSSGGSEPPGSGEGGGGGGGGGGNPVPQPPACPTVPPQVRLYWGWSPAGTKYLLNVDLVPNPLDSVRVTVTSPFQVESEPSWTSWLFSVPSLFLPEGSSVFNVRVETLAASCPGFPIDTSASIQREKQYRSAVAGEKSAFVQSYQINIGLAPSFVYSRQTFHPDVDLYSTPPEFDQLLSKTYVDIVELPPLPYMMLPYQVHVLEAVTGIGGNSESRVLHLNMVGSAPRFEGYEEKWYPATDVLPVGVAHSIQSGEYFQMPTGGTPPQFPPIQFPWGPPATAFNLGQ